MARRHGQTADEIADDLLIVRRYRRDRHVLGLITLLEGASAARAARLRVAVLEALGDLRDERGAEISRRLLRDGDQAERAAAALAVGRIGGEGAVVALGDAAIDSARNVRAWTAFAAAELGSDGGLHILKELQMDEAWTVRRAAVRALGHIGTRDACDALRKSLNDPSFRVRVAARTRLVRRCRRVSSVR